MKPVEDQTILVTGSTDGHGRRVAEELVGHGANVIVHGRDPEKTRSVASAHRRRAGARGGPRIARRGAPAGGERGPLDTLVNNAGIVSAERRTSLDGHELTFAVNYLSHFLLTALLLEGLVEPARIVNVASIGQRPLDFDDPMYERDYDGYGAYARSKLAQVIWTFDLADRLGDREVTVNALHPATLMDTKMVRDTLRPAAHAPSTRERARRCG